MERIEPVAWPVHPTLTFFRAGEESAIYSARSRRLYGLDRTATAALLRLSRGEEPEALLQTPRLTKDYFETVCGLAALLAGEEPADREEYRTELPCSREVPVHGKGLPVYRLLETNFALDGPEDVIRKEFLPYIAHMGTGAAGPIHLLASIEPRGALWRLRLNGSALDDLLPAERLLPVFCGRLRLFACQSSPSLLSMHATAVNGGGNTLVLAGRSGTGKSTLAAGLLARGYALLSDEPTVIDLPGAEVLPVPLGLGLKAGSWPAVLPDYPALDTLPVHVRFDGQPMRYLVPGSIRQARKVPATHLLFPKYTPGSSGGMEPLGSIQALRAITEAGYQVPDLDASRVERILRWIGGLTCCALAYSSSEEALALIGEIVGRTGP